MSTLLLLAEMHSRAAPAEAASPERLRPASSPQLVSAMKRGRSALEDLDAIWGIRQRPLAESPYAQANAACCLLCALHRIVILSCLVLDFLSSSDMMHKE